MEMENQLLQRLIQPSYRSIKLQHEATAVDQAIAVDSAKLQHEEAAISLLILSLFMDNVVSSTHQ